MHNRGLFTNVESSDSDTSRETGSLPFLRVMRQQRLRARIPFPVRTELPFIEPLAPLVFNRYPDDTPFSRDGTIQQLEDQLMMSLIENDRLREELAGETRRAMGKVHERNKDFLGVITELIAVYAQPQVDVTQALRNLISHQEVQTRDTSSVCTICWDVPATVIFRPCNHLVACTRCVVKSVATEGVPGSEIAVRDIVENRVARSIAGLDKPIECPRCRAYVNDMLYVYI